MKKILSITFVLILFAPLAVWLARLDFGMRVEHLGLKPPRFDARALLNNDYYRSFDQYLNDRFSLRDPLLYAKRWLDYRLFKMTDTSAVHVGRQGWLFSRKSIEDHQKQACDDQLLIERLVLDLQAVDHILSASGRQFMFTVAPNKSSIYPEYLGFIPSGGSCGRSRYDLLLKAFERHPLKSFVRLENRLRNAKAEHLWLYNPTGTYWNDQGARVAAEAIREKAMQDAAHDWAFDHSQNKNNTGHHVDLAKRMLGLFAEVEDDAAIQLTSSEALDRPDAVFYGDGYVKTLMPYLSQFIGNLKVIQADRVPSRHYNEDLKAVDIILLQAAESRLAKVRLDVDQIYTTFEADALLPISYRLDPDAFVPQANISLNKRAASLEIKSVGDPSRFAIMSIPGSDNQVFRLLKLTVEAPHSDTMTFNFNTDPPLITRKALRPGLTVLHLPLPFEKTLTLSINPGNKAGVLMLQSAQILTFATQRATTEQRQLKNLLAKWPSDRDIALAKQNSEVDAAVANPAPPISRSKVDSQDSAQTVQPDVPVSALKAAFEEVFADQEKRSAKNAREASTLKPAPTISNVEKSKNDVDRKIAPEKNNPGIAAAQSSPVAPERNFDNAKDEAANKKDHTRVSRIVTKRPPSSPAITLADFADGRIFQRRKNSADIVISGTYSGSLQAIEARVVRSDTQEQIVPWTVVDPSPANGIFVGRLESVPQGGWYNLQVRSQGNHGIRANGRHRWGVGMLIACLGQSNMKEWFHTGKDLKAHSLLRKFGAQGWVRLGTTGNAAIAFGNRIIEQLPIPIGLLDFAVNGSGLRKEADWGTGYWADTAPGSIYHRFIKGVSRIGGKLEYVIWIQGEADAAKETVTQQEYAVSLTHFINNQMRIDIANGSQREQLPILVVMMIKRPGGKDQPHQAIRNAQKQVVETVSDCYLAATTLDLKNHGRQHLTPKAYIVMGQRVAQAVLHIVGKEPYHRGPQVVAARRIDDTTVEIKIKHNGGNDFMPVSGISGWEVITDGRPVPIKEVYRHDARTIRIVTAQTIGRQASIHYLFGAMPDVKHPVLDNSPLSLPLEEYQSEIN